MDGALAVPCRCPGVGLAQGWASDEDEDEEEMIPKGTSQPHPVPVALPVNGETQREESAQHGPELRILAPSLGSGNG